MKHYELRLQRDLDAITRRVMAVAASVGKAVDEAVRGVLSEDADRMYAVVLADLPINREVRAIDAECHAFVARHLPAAGPLRLVSSVLRMNIGLERVGDYAVTISRVGTHMSAPVPEALQAGIRDLTDMVTRMLDRAAQSFEGRDEELAAEVVKTAKRADAAHSALFHRILALEGTMPLPDIVGLVTLIANLERVSDQAKNFCEEAIFAASGRTKAPKVYSVLFVDRDDALLAPLALAVARRAFPESGRYFSAGLQPASALDRRLLAAADRLRLDLSGIMPRPVSTLLGPMGDFHVIVVLGLDDERVEVEVPFATACQRWRVGRPAPGDGPMDDLARELGARVRELMELLRGPDAS